ncbi:MAG TPA: helix-turn-helix domain-containing protein [Pyrinomonadaceae bacterium]
MKTKDQVNSKPSDQNPEGRTRDGSGGGGAANSLGERLRQARQQRGTSLREISDHTRISMQYLEAIETDDYKRLPGGIFNRSFIKAYARHINFDEKEALELYTRTAGEAFDEVATSPVRSRVYTDGDSSRSPLLTFFLSALILGILVLGVYAGLHFYRRTENTAANNNANPSASPAANAVQNASGTQQQGSTVAPANAATAGFQIQVKTKGQQVWLRSRMDEERQTEVTLGADETKEFAPQTRLSIWYSKSKVGALEVSINGQVAREPTPVVKGGLVEWVINKDDYKQFLP